MTRLITISETAAFMIDWAAFLDDVTYQDPEVAQARGHGAVPLPVGVPSAISLPEAAFLSRSPAVRRRWRSTGAIGSGEQLLMTTSERSGRLRSRFDGLGFTAEEILEPARWDHPTGPGEASSEPSAFRTSAPVQLTRLRALAWGLNDMLPAEDEARFDRWGGEAGHVRVLAAAVLLPTLLALYVLGHGPATNTGPVEVETLARVSPAMPYSRLAVHRHGAAGATAVATDGTVATITVGMGSDAPPPRRVGVG